MPLDTKGLPMVFMLICITRDMAIAMPSELNFSGKDNYLILFNNDFRFYEHILAHANICCDISMNREISLR